ncbi:hypothetical protein [Mucilaginibacter phyllosphaerae]|uniref:Neurotransmitter-gated ion-channel ligand-binding domain-containing protein n=1 Tax=Mucilaginibacter phyllosphaerae TaxID=1812349 RepID=A0A4Y8AFV2_9SPHI|nr:hypothetical protein [Mucilaginibacter phyllosphaerae]MBB3968710.1 hypothetical protein [Mucilaginibacter phyllosphaerae]TEW67654.1 hypothetical protein E2R65_06595 [Mucilaginibacter phyllosphaerae]
MVKRLYLAFTFIAILFTQAANAQAKKPDTVRAGIYITSIHDINFKDKEYTVSLWLWLKYKNKKFDFLHNLEVPQAKTVTQSYSTVDSSDNRIYILMKLQCVMKDSWAIDNFPFDQQKLRFSIENSQFDSKSLVFAADTLGKHFDPRFTLRGWNIDSLDISTGIKKYETAFGDESMAKPHTEYSNFKVWLTINRNAMGLFWKMFLGMYVAFLIAYMCFYIHTDSIDSRFGLSVGALFAVIGNKYIVDSALPESTTFTLVDTLHGLTLLFILSVIIGTSYSLRLIKRDKVDKAKRFDFIAAQVLLGTYIILNAWFIFEATRV